MWIVGSFWESTHGDCIYHFCHIHWSELIHVAIPNVKGAWEICMGSVVVAHGLSCCEACGSFLSQEDWTHVSCICRWILYPWATREAPNRILELLRWLSGEESACQAGEMGSIPGSGSSPGKGNGNPLQYSCLGNPKDRGAWRATVHGITKSQTQLGDLNSNNLEMRSLWMSKRRRK